MQLQFLLLLLPQFGIFAFPEIAMKKLRETYDKYKAYIQTDLLMYLTMVIIIALLFLFFA